MTSCDILTSRAVGDLEMETGAKQSPTGLAGVELLGRMDGFKILVVGPHDEQVD